MNGGACAVHDAVAAGFRCDGCGALLCDDCIEVGEHLILCGLCGERVLPLPGTPDPTRRESLAPPPRPEADLGVTLTRHVVVPGAIVAMVTAFLFFLVDLRSVFLPSGSTLKWLGFWFVLATVLIARYGKLSSDRERQGCYTVFLGLAMALVLIVQPWEERSAGPLGTIANAAIVLAVWLYATRLTARLSTEGEEGSPDGKAHRLYGLERLEIEAWQRRQDDSRLALRRQREKAGEAQGEADAHGNPSAAVARLAAAALAVFALGEPLVLAGPPAVGERALAATVVFLLASGLVLAAGSAVGVSRHARRLGGSVARRLVASRVAAAGLLMLVLLTVTLAVPGVAYRGSGELVPRPAPEGVESRRGGGESKGEERGGGKAGGGGESSRLGREAGRAVATATGMLDSLTALGKLLVLPFLIAVFLGGLWVLSRLAPFLATMGLAGWRGWLARLAATLGRRRKKTERRRGRRISAHLDLGGLSSMEPRAAVITGYARLLASLEALGYARDCKTPNEILEGLPGHLRRLRKPLERLTEIYVRAAYGRGKPEDRDRRETVGLLADMRRLLQPESRSAH